MAGEHTITEEAQETIILILKRMHIMNNKTS